MSILLQGTLKVHVKSPNLKGLSITQVIKRCTQGISFFFFSSSTWCLHYMRAQRAVVRDSRVLTKRVRGCNTGCTGQTNRGCNMLLLIVKCDVENKEKKGTYRWPPRCWLPTLGNQNTHTRSTRWWWCQRGAPRNLTPEVMEEEGEHWQGRSSVCKKQKRRECIVVYS